MEQILLENVYCDSGIPKYTFVEPIEYTKTKVALRTKGRGVVVEGPSGIGKTTCIKKILENIGMSALCLSARKKEDLEYIDLLLQDPIDAGTVIIDDFHLLKDELKQSVSDLLKVLADESREDAKIILIGINRAGESLIQLAPDLNNRIDTIKFEANPLEKITELITKGEQMLNISIEGKNDIAKKSYGSFHIAQMLCKTLCISKEITERQSQNTLLAIPISEIIDVKMQELSRLYSTAMKTFALGNRSRRDGRAPYLKLLTWLAECDKGAIQMNEIYNKYPQYKVSISQIADKGYITKLLLKRENETLRDLLYYDSGTKVLAVEDPKFIFYLKNTNWDVFTKEVGFKIEEVKTQYDFALSFAGEKREYAEALFQKLTDSEYSVFYDKNSVADILGEDLEEYFAPIYQADATYVIAMIDSNYPKKVWTVFESKQYKERFGDNTVIPILFEDFTPSPLDTLYNKGYERLDTTGNVEEQLTTIVDHLIEKMNK